MTEISFWKLESDSLNITKVDNSDGTVSKYSMSDGINFKVEILQGNNFRIIESYEPEYFFSKMPEIKDREIFIQGKVEIEKIFAK